jgi:hypothetical protein
LDALLLGKLLDHFAEELGVFVVQLSQQGSGLLNHFLFIHISAPSFGLFKPAVGLMAYFLSGDPPFCVD